MTGQPRLHELFGFVWCTTCHHDHIPDIPTVTFACAGPPDTEDAYGVTCGFGVWEFELAVKHATDYPEHIVHAVHHQTVPERP